MTAIDGSSTKHDVDGVDAVFGAGLEMSITNEWRIRASWDRYETDDDRTSVAMLGVVRSL